MQVKFIRAEASDIALVSLNPSKSPATQSPAWVHVRSADPEPFLW